MFRLLNSKIIQDKPIIHKNKILFIRAFRSEDLVILILKKSCSYKRLIRSKKVDKMLSTVF